MYDIYISDQYRVRTDRDYKCKGPMSDYLLKVYDEKIILYSSNGKLPTGFVCYLKEIYQIKHLSTKQQKPTYRWLSITIKNARSKYVATVQ